MIKLCGECGTSGHTLEEHTKIFNYWIDKIDNMRQKGRVSDQDMIKDSPVFFETFHKFPDCFTLPKAFKEFGMFQFEANFIPCNGPITIESFEEEQMECRNVTITCCKYCNSECNYQAIIDNWFCNTCGYTRYADELYHKTISKKVPKMPFGVFDWHLSKPKF